MPNEIEQTTPNTTPEETTPEETIPMEHDSKEEVNGAYPRFPLYMIEINPQTGLAIRSSKVLIDTRRTGESDKVQLSNFCILEDRAAGTLEIYLSKLGQFSGKPTYECETWKYTLYLPVDEKE